MNIAVDVNWDRLDLGSGDGKKVFSALKERIGRQWAAWMRSDHSLDKLAFIGSHENPGGAANTHWCLHVPQRLQGRFRRSVTKILGEITGCENLGKALYFRRVDHPGAAAKYVLKGINEVYAPYFQMTAVEQGFVPGRGRTFTSRSIGWTARAEAGWKRKRRPRNSRSEPGAHQPVL